MERKPDIRIIIPAFNEENAVGKVVKEIPMDLVKEVIVVNNGSVDQTSKEASKAGATVLDQPQKGYGRACLKGIDYLKTCDNTDIVVFLDADYSDYPEETYKLIEPITKEGYDMVIGSRALGNREKGSMTPQQIFGNWLATRMIRWFYDEHFTDLGPFRAIKYQKLLELNMQDQTYGWTVEMQVKAARKKLKSTEVPVKYRQRIGVSKVSGTVKGTVMAGYKIITTILRYAG
ncbi:glycosyltransferase family 2 protein [Mangrovivirga sp. M17]|uniref:Glycosyltransferase family 2 protein n=1 Tax=Mangrovivirga halotolerans TaxID=2993936 RepID=A0ABT3RTL2_9BACT|nr:glycosyltransferase family 2 protein [Mangrovivirga halotolerans]MCX2745115.1 glycosyltransferase family 2 protein [Mangrovivirga halotolerans]